MNGQSIVIAGGSGFIGHALARNLANHGYLIRILTRQPCGRTDGAQEVVWDGQNLGGWVNALEGSAALINLTGRSINCRHTPENLATILSSRVNSAHALARACQGLKAPPRVWVQASAIGYYGDTGNNLVDETAPPGQDILSGICREWEGAFTSAALPNIRRVILRIGFVLGRESGALPVLARLTKFFLGGSAGSGRQFISWIHLQDLVGIITQMVENPQLEGVYNGVAPEPVTNAEFMRRLRFEFKRPWSPPAPAMAVKLGARFLGTEGSLALVSQRCSAQKILNTGFQFHFRDLAPALHDLCPAFY